MESLRDHDGIKAEVTGQENISDPSDQRHCPEMNTTD